MALCANYPIAVAPGMGLNAYFTYTVVLASNGQVDYITAFSAVFVAGILFVILSLTPFREKLITAIPENLKLAITAGIGLFIAFIGLRMSKVIVADPSNLVKLGDLTSASVLLTLFGLVVTVILMARNVNGAIFIGMIVTGIVGILTGQLHIEKIVALPHLPEGILVWNPIDAIANVIEFGLYGVVFSFILVTLFDTTGTMIGVAKQAGLMKNDKLPRARKALLSRFSCDNSRCNGWYKSNNCFLRIRCWCCCWWSYRSYFINSSSIIHRCVIFWTTCCIAFKCCSYYVPCVNYRR